jgi:uncharacterized protein (UPF0264 family)
VTPGLLVSVRSVEEAEEALAGGADLIDVKEPARGALGRADDATIGAIEAQVAGRRPTSAALGELRDLDGVLPPEVDFVKAGPAQLTASEWRSRIDVLRRVASQRVVIVAYADWQCAQAPALGTVVDYAAAIPECIVLLDTHCKDNFVAGRRATLLDWLPLDGLAVVVDRIHSAGGRIAVAGSLGPTEIAQVVPLGPDWIAVRGAACDEGRSGNIHRRRVRELAHLVGYVSNVPTIHEGAPRPWHFENVPHAG